MMPLGSHSVAGRSSNLSPLAPPFTLDKPYHNQPNSNPPLNLIDNGSRNGKFPSQAHGFPDFQSNSSSLSDPLRPAASDRYVGSPYGQHSNSVPSSLVDAKPYYPPYVAVGDGDSVPGNEPGDDLLANFGSGKSSRVWHGMSNEEQRNSLKKLGGSFVPHDYKPPPPPNPEFSRVWNGTSREEQRESLKNFGCSYKPPKIDPVSFCVWDGLSNEEQHNSLKNLGGSFGPQDYKPPQVDPELSRLWNGLSKVEQRNSLNLDGSCGPRDYQPPQVDPEWSHVWNGMSNVVQQMSLESFGPLDYKPPQVDPEWSRVWNGMSNAEQRSLLNLGCSFGQLDYKPPVSSAGQTCIKKGKLPVGSLESYVETPVKSKNCFGGFGGEDNFESRSMEGHKSFKEPNPGTATGSCIWLAATDPTSACDKNRHLQDPSFQAPPIPKCFGLYESPLDSQDKNANYTDSYFLDSTSTMRSSPENPIRLTFGGFPSPQDAALSITLNSMNSGAINETETPSDFLPYHPFGHNFQVRSYAGKADNLLTRSPSPKMDNNAKNTQGNKDCFNQVLRTESAPSSPHLSMAGCLQKKSDTAVTFFSKEISSVGPEIQNPAVDSPCWKGVPAARFCPVEDSKLVRPDDILENLESRFKLCSEENKKKPTGPHTNDTMHASEEVNEKNSSIKSSDANYVSKICATRLKFHTGIELYPGDGFRSLDKKNGLDDAMKNELSFMEYSGIASSSTSPQSLQINLEDCEAVPKEKLAKLKGKCFDLAASRGFSCAPTNVSDDLLHSPSENLPASKVGHLFGKDLDSKVDTGVLINAMKTLSEVLVDHCLNSDVGSTELYNVSLKHIISNLNSCLVKEADKVTQTEKAMEPQQGTSSLEDELQSSMVRTATSAHSDPHSLDILGDGKHDICSSRNEGLLEASFLKDDAETVRDADTIQAIKRVLNMKFLSEELQPETVLYKNLWLEAEASLCATNVRSRFERLKIEMEKREYHRMKDEENNPILGASDVNEVAEPSNEAKNSLDSSKLGYPADMESSVVARFCIAPPNTDANHIVALASPSATPQSSANDIEVSVVARLQILKYRADNLELESLNTEDGKSSIGNSETPPSSNPSSQDSCFSSIDSHKDDPEASVMSRFNILKSRTEHPDSLHMDTHQLPEPVDEPTLSSFICAQNRSSDVQCEGESVKDCMDNDKFFEEWEHVFKEAFP